MKADLLDLERVEVGIGLDDVIDVIVIGDERVHDPDPDLDYVEVEKRSHTLSGSPLIPHNVSN